MTRRRAGDVETLTPRQRDPIGFDAIAEAHQVALGHDPEPPAHGQLPLGERHPRRR